MEWLHATIDERSVDALLVSGDIFDSANPSAEAQNMWYRFLAESRIRFPELNIVVIGGNHDSAARLNAPNPVLDALKIRVVGGLPRQGRQVDCRAACVPLTKGGRVVAWVAAVPYLRPADLPLVSGGDPLVEGVRGLYEDVFRALDELLEEGQALLAMGHCYMTGARLSELSERKVLGGNQHALPADIFPERVAYAALGHLHLAQEVTRSSIRYSGSPIPLSLSERTYEHQVVQVDLDGDSVAGMESVPVPRTVQMCRVPRHGSKPLREVLDQLEALEVEENPDQDAPRPFLEVAVTLDKPEPSLRSDIESAIEGKGVYLAKISTEYTGHGMALGESANLTGLREMKAEEVFRHCWSRSHDGEIPPYLMEAFHELLEEIHQEAGA